MGSYLAKFFCAIRKNSFFIILCSINVGLSKNYENSLYRDLIENYDSRERPVFNYSDAIEVFFGVSLQQLIDVDEKNEVVIFNMWLQVEWTDQNMMWNPDQYDNITSICLPSKLIWKPDVLLYNSVHKKFDTSYASNVVVSSNGWVLWVPPAIVKISCNMDITWFPFDEQTCYFKFGSWSYTQRRLNLQKHKDKLFDRSEYITNVEWDLLEQYVVVKEVNYNAENPDPYRSLIFNFKIRRRILYYAFNLILPSTFIFFMTLLGFALPVECCEKITLEITILVAICVFLTMLMNVMPSTSESVPLIGIFFSFHIFLVSSSVFFQVVVLNLYHRNPAIQEPMSPMTRFVLIKFLPWLLGIERPGHKVRWEDVKYESKISKNSSDDSMQESSNQEDLDKRVDRCLIDLTENRTRNPYFGAFILTLRQTYGDLKNIANRMKDQDMCDDHKNDWKFAAKVVDTLLLLFLRMSHKSSTGLNLRYFSGSAPNNDVLEKKILVIAETPEIYKALLKNAIGSKPLPLPPPSDKTKLQLMNASKTPQRGILRRIKSLLAGSHISFKILIGFLFWLLLYSCCVASWYKLDVEKTLMHD